VAPQNRQSEETPPENKGLTTKTATKL